MRAVFPLMFWYFCSGKLLAAGRQSQVSPVASSGARPAMRDGTKPTSIPGFALKQVTALAK